jgi:hypothetical protein
MSTCSDSRGENLTIDTAYSSPFEIPPLKGKEAEYRKMHAKDRERSIHSTELYAVWNAKPFFLDAAVHSFERQKVGYDYAFWNDAGSSSRGKTRPSLCNAIFLLYPERLITMWYNDPDTPAHFAEGDGSLGIIRGFETPRGYG